MARRDKRRARERRRQRRAAQRLDRPPVSRPRRATLTRDAAARLLARPQETAAGALLGTFTDPSDPVLELLRPLVLAALDRAPKILEHPSMHTPLVILALRRPQWIRPLSSWHPVGRGRGRQFRSLLDHLLVRYPVPRFLYEVFWASPTTSAEIDLFVHLAQGGSVRAACEAGLLPSTLTKAMCHRFVHAPAEATIVEAVRIAQVAGHSGEAWLARELNRTFLGRSFGDEVFWSAAIGWLCRHSPVARGGDVAHVLDYLRHRRQHDPTFMPEACRLQGLWRLLGTWQTSLSELPVADEQLPASGIAGRSIGLPMPGQPDTDEHWEVIELRGARVIAQEGHEMRHCVASYISEVRHGGTSIWSMRREGRRRLTIEVCNRSRRVVQAKGRRNRDPTDREITVLRAWAHGVGLRLR